MRIPNDVKFLVKKLIERDEGPDHLVLAVLYEDWHGSQDLVDYCLEEHNYSLDKEYINVQKNLMIIDDNGDYLPSIYTQSDDDDDIYDYDSEIEEYVRRDTENVYTNRSCQQSAQSTDNGYPNRQSAEITCANLESDFRHTVEAKQKVKPEFDYEEMLLIPEFRDPDEPFVDMSWMCTIVGRTPYRSYHGETSERAESPSEMEVDVSECVIEKLVDRAESIPSIGVVSIDSDVLMDDVERTKKRKRKRMTEEGTAKLRKLVLGTPSGESDVITRSACLVTNAHISERFRKLVSDAAFSSTIEEVEI